MKTALLAFLSIIAVASAEPRPTDLMDGQISRDVAAGLQKAKASGKPAVLVTFDAKNKEMTNDFTLEGFFKMPETRKLLAHNFVQIFAPWSAKGVEQYRDAADKTSLPVAIFINSDGTLITRVPFQYGPADALRKVQEVVAGLPTK